MSGRQPVIAGVGHTAFGKLPGRSTPSMHLEAIGQALHDAKVSKDEVDGLLVKYPSSHFEHMYAQSLAQRMGIRPKIGGVWDQAGAALGSLIGYAAMAVREGALDVAVVSYADNPKTSTRQAYQESLGNYAVDGWAGAVGGYAMLTSAHQATYGTTWQELGALAVTCRGNAATNPRAQLRKPITLDDYAVSPPIVDPLRRDDCCLVSDGGAAVVVMSEERARRVGVEKPIAILGYGQAQESWDVAQRPRMAETVASVSAQDAFAMARLKPTDIDVAQIYDCFTITLLMTLEDYGFGEKGAVGRMALDGAFDLDGTLPINTSGGLLAETGMPGMQLTIEAVRQLRGDAVNQVNGVAKAIVSNQGGIMHTHSTLILGS